MRISHLTVWDLCEIMYIKPLACVHYVYSFPSCAQVISCYGRGRNGQQLDLLLGLLDSELHAHTHTPDRGAAPSEKTHALVKFPSETTKKRCTWIRIKCLVQSWAQSRVGSVGTAFRLSSIFNPWLEHLCRLEGPGDHSSPKGLDSWYHEDWTLRVSFTFGLKSFADSCLVRPLRPSIGTRSRATQPLSLFPHL